MGKQFVSTRWAWLLVGLLSAAAQLAAAPTDTICFHNRPIQTAADLLAGLRRHGYILAYNPAHLTDTMRIDHPAGCLPLHDLLELLAPRRFYHIDRRGRKIIFVRRERPIILSGAVREAGTNGYLMGATVRLIDDRDHIGTHTNEQGRFALTVPDRNARLAVSYIGYQTDTVAVRAGADNRFDIELHPVSQTLREVYIQASPLGAGLVRQGQRLQVGWSTEAAFSTIAPDPLAAVASLPGVTGGLSGFSAYGVRGGSNAENLVLLNGIPVYNWLHLFGLLSVIDHDALRSATFYQGLFPSRYSGRLASVLDLRLRDGDLHNYHGTLSVDLLKARGRIEGPIIPGRLSFMSSVRTNTLPWGLWVGANELRFRFIDSYTQLTAIVNDRHRINASYYFGQDLSVGMPRNQGLRWGNHLTAVDWQAALAPNLLLGTTAHYSYYNNTDGLLSSIRIADSTGRRPAALRAAAVSPDGPDFGRRSPSLPFAPDAGARTTVSDVTLQSQLDWYTHRNARVKAGLSVAHHYVYTGEARRRQVLDLRRSWEAGAWADIDLRLADVVELGIGANFTAYRSGNYGKLGLLPRLRIGYSPTGATTLYGGYSQMAQFYHELSAPFLALPGQLRVWANQDLPPATAHLTEVGIRFLAGTSLTVDLSAYHRASDRLITFRPGQDWIDHWALDWRDRITAGTAQSMGATLALHYVADGFRLQTSATYTHATECYRLVNGGNPFRSNNAPVWMAKLSATAPLAKNLQLTLNAGYSSGRYMTVPTFLFRNPLEVPPAGNNRYNYLVTGINEYQLPYRLMLNMGVSWLLSKPGSSLTQVLRVGLSNIAGRSEPVMQWIHIDHNRPTIQSISLPICFPQLNYEIKF